MATTDQQSPPALPQSPLPPWRGVEIWPLLHGVLEFAVAIRQRLLTDPPDAIAVELPETLTQPVMRAVDRLPYLSMVHYDSSAGAVYVPVEPTDGAMEALRFALEQDLPAYLVDRDTEDYPLVHGDGPDPHAVSIIGYEAFCRAWLDNPPPVDPDLAAQAAAEDELREDTMAYHLQRLAEQHERVLFVCGLDHAQGIRDRLEGPLVRPIGRLRRDGVLPYALDPKASREVTGEAPYLMNAYEDWRATDTPEQPPTRTAAQRELYLAARENYRTNRKEDLGLDALSVMRRFSRNYALVEGRLAPDFFQTLIAARGSGGDDFAYEVWELGSGYAHQEDPPSLQGIAPTVEELYRSSRSIRFRRTLKQRRQRLRLVGGKRHHERYKGEWKDNWDPGFICSHQPQDIAVESYGHFLMKKSQLLLSEENSRVEPFATSVLDGIDVRETIRNWHEGQIYVRENRPSKGQVGSVVVIFDPDDDERAGEQYTHTMTWQGEHAQESDMALYSTEPGDHFDGPGIARCEYGGFLLSYPPGRMFQVFEDPYFDAAQSKPERLLLAAIDYCQETQIAYVAAKPPRSIYKAYAGRFGKKIVYLPIGQLSPITLKKIRTFHVLSNHKVRDWAKDYID